MEQIPKITTFPQTEMGLTLVLVLLASQVKPSLSITAQDCPWLPKLSHGVYNCTRPKSHAKENHRLSLMDCRLSCHPGYVIPLIEKPTNEKPLLLETRGLYNCYSTPEGIARWHPAGLFYDCVRGDHPRGVMLYYLFDVPSEMGRCDMRDAPSVRMTLETALNNSVTQEICDDYSVWCNFKMYLSCENTRLWRLTIRVEFNFTTDTQLTKAVGDEIDKVMKFDAYQYTLHKHSPNVTKLTGKAMNIDCPKGTKFDRDYKCHGCYKGYFMNGSSMTCDSCPPRTYQDHDLQTFCHACPLVSHAEIQGGDHLASCFRFDELAKGTELGTMAAFLTTIVFVVVGIFYAHLQLSPEMDPKAGLLEEKPKSKTKKPINAKLSESDQPPTLSFTFESTKSTYSKFESSVDKLSPSSNLPLLGDEQVSKNGIKARKSGSVSFKQTKSPALDDIKLWKSIADRSDIAESQAQGSSQQETTTSYKSIKSKESKEFPWFLRKVKKELIKLNRED